jgi:GAF domain-containing protein
MARDELLGRTFVELADTLVDGFDLIEFLQLLADRCVALLGVSEAGLVLADPAGNLRVLASSSERMRDLELFEVQNQDGPCLDTWRSGAPASEPHLAEAGARRWPQFAPVALDAGFASVYALPMRLRDTRIGALNLFADKPNGLAADDADLGQAMADVASISILQERFTHEQHVLTDQLQAALNSRVILEQAKGFVAEQAKVDMDRAFALLRGYARHHNRRLGDVALDVINRRLDAPALGSPRAGTS